MSKSETTNKVYGVIYKITNLVNNKCYIGQTKQKNPYFRFKQHKYTKNRILYYAIKKHGVENFSFEIIENCYSQDELNLLEEKYINFYKSDINQFGYNLTTLCNGFAKHSKTTLKKLSEKANRPFNIERVKELGKKSRGKTKGKSQYVGVTKRKNHWTAGYFRDNNYIYLGTYKTEIEAAQARDIAELLYIGNNAILNFPELKGLYLNNEIKLTKIIKLKGKIIYQGNVKGISYCNTHNKWRYSLKGIQKRFNTQEEAERFAIDLM